MRLHLLLFLLLPFAASAQSKQIDSLTSALRTAGTDTARVRLHTALSKQFALTDIARATDYAKAAEKLATDSRFLPGLAAALQQRAQLLFLLGEFDKSMAKHYRALELGLQLKDTAIIVTSYIGLGALSNNTGNQGKAFAHYATAEKLAVKSKNALALSKVYNNIGHIHAEHKENGKALGYFLRAEKALEPTGNKKTSAVVKLNIGETYTLLGQPGKGRAYLEKALALDGEIHNRMNTPLILGNIAKTYLAENRVPAALAFALESYRVAVGIGSSKKTLAASQLVTEIYAKQGDFERAYHFQTISDGHTAKLAQENQNRNAAEMTARFENEKLDLKAQRLTAEKETQALEIRNQRVFLAVGVLAFFLTLVCAAELYLRRRKLKESHAQLRAASELMQGQNLEINRQKEEIAAQADALRRQNEELGKHSRFKSKVFSIVSHDLRSPFTTLQGILALAKGDRLTESDMKRIFEVLGKDVEVITEMLNNLLVWSKNQMDGSALHPQPVNLGRLADKCVEVVWPGAQHKGISIENRIGQNILVLADEESIAFVIRNLLANAVKFSYEGGKVTLRASRENGKVRLAVVDAGKGISERNLGKLFTDRRFTTLGTSKEVGTGLGLMLCKELLEGQNGTILVESREGRGTMFSVLLPPAGSVSYRPRKEELSAAV